MQIYLVEKYISINGDNENIFKEGRPAYLIKVTADDELELTELTLLLIKKYRYNIQKIFSIARNLL